MPKKILTLIHTDVEDQKAYLEDRFHRSIMFMHTTTNRDPYKRESNPCTFCIYKVEGANVFINLHGDNKMPEELASTLGLVKVKEWTLIRRQSNVFFVGLSSEAIIAENVVPMEIRVEGARDAERCWSGH
ncbi:hypothetical protein pEaSNUABM45_00072 [Erwinia phage pEa_SNUABM_45]|nr:hypothetical protein pEaSNUABM45_00072 [Erwinia phage pEa_SNUABM_45]